MHQAGVRISRNLAPDASPQGQYEFFNTIEELMIRPVPLQIDVRELQDAFKGFDYVRRAMVPQTLAKGEANTAAKVQRMTHQAILQSGADKLVDFRHQTKGYLSDQAGT